MTFFYLFSYFHSIRSYPVGTKDGAFLRSWLNVILPIDLLFCRLKNFFADFFSFLAKNLSLKSNNKKMEKHLRLWAQGYSCGMSEIKQKDRKFDPLLNKKV